MRPSLLSTLAHDIASHTPAELDAIAGQLAPLLGLIASAWALSENVVEDRWLTTAEAASYLAISRDRLCKLATAGTIASEQDRPGCKRYYRPAELDRWREAGGRRERLPIDGAVRDRSTRRHMHGFHAASRAAQAQ